MNLTGRWVGKTLGCETRLHQWVIIQHGDFLNIYSRWDDEPRLRLYNRWVIVRGKIFTLYTTDGEYQARIRNPESFIVLGWIRETYNVVFQRKDKGAKAVFYRILLRTLLAMREGLQRLGNATSDPVLLVR